MFPRVKAVEIARGTVLHFNENTINDLSLIYRALAAPQAALEYGVHYITEVHCLNENQTMFVFSALK